MGGGRCWVCVPRGTGSEGLKAVKDSRPSLVRDWHSEALWKRQSKTAPCKLALPRATKDPSPEPPTGGLFGRARGFGR